MTSTQPWAGCTPPARRRRNSRAAWIAAAAPGRDAAEELAERGERRQWSAATTSILGWLTTPTARRGGTADRDGHGAGVTSPAGSSRSAGGDARSCGAAAASFISSSGTLRNRPPMASPGVTAGTRCYRAAKYENVVSTTPSMSLACASRRASA